MPLPERKEENKQEWKKVKRLLYKVTSHTTRGNVLEPRLICWLFDARRSRMDWPAMLGAACGACQRVKIVNCSYQTGRACES